MSEDCEVVTVGKLCRGKAGSDNNKAIQMTWIATNGWMDSRYNVRVNLFVFQCSVFVVGSE